MFDERQYWKAFDNARRTYFKRFEKVCFDMLKSHLNSYLSNKSIPETATKSTFVNLYTTVAPEFAYRTYQQLSGKSFEVELTKDAPFSIPNEWVQFFKRFALKDLAERIINITETSREIIKNILKVAGESGLSIPDTVKLLKEKFLGLARSRATTIARTEIINASNAGSLYGAEKKAKDFKLKLKKKWLSTKDSRTRDIHISANGQTKPLSDLFSVNGEKLSYPGDSLHGASGGNVINCRCTLTYET